jgi:hypothetical protein
MRSVCVCFMLTAWDGNCSYCSRYSVLRGLKQPRKRKAAICISTCCQHRSPPRGTWIPVNPKDHSADETETELDCYKGEGLCIEATADYFAGHPHIAVMNFQIIKWDSNGIVASSAHPSIVIDISNRNAPRYCAPGNGDPGDALNPHLPSPSSTPIGSSDLDDVLRDVVGSLDEDLITSIGHREVNCSVLARGGAWKLIRPS